MTSPIPEELLRTRETPRNCSYISGETACLEYRLFRRLRSSQVEYLLSRGWRRFGVNFFRPTCPSCTKCIPIRIRVAEFKPSKSQRRVQRKNSQITVARVSPTVSREHLDLYHRWHEDMTDRRGWAEANSTVEEYASGFLSGEFDCLHELRYFDGTQLVGVGLIDVLPNSLSSAYFYHDPEWRPRAPGTFSLLCELSLAKHLGLEYVYLGYWIEECPSMAYKNRFPPSEILTEFVDDDEEPTWRMLSD
ncbi:arginyl-tRNA-protein transferase [Thalassoglobus neptunius]|uniref:Aspartate/glutamate leucyltransferase n=1 Tax=Thalassoglobus neptunius TaxID=1938619 RepID=A0A5C5X1I4_9PLAN|nr:arginyltransferase [Thalassoglobus neptunius]TWT56826.1 arginyl-tRNA-protein transferase [Thalassoglobus neptunius]